MLHSRQHSRKVSSWQEFLVIAIVIVLITGRFFTERVVILPRFINTIDLVAVPFLLPLCLLWVVSHQGGRFKGKSIVLLSVLFCIAWALAWLVNYNEVNWLGGLLLVVGLLTPVLFFLILINFGLDRRFCRRLLRVLNILFIINLVLATIDAASAIITNKGGGDFVFGTFGMNQNQLAFFLAVMITFKLTRWHFQGLRLQDQFILGWAVLLFLLCGFQTLWVVLPVVMMCGFGLVGQLWSKRLLRVITVVVVLVAIIMPSLMNSGRFFSMTTKAEQFVANFNDLGKVELLRNVPLIWQLRPYSFFLGVGPGTFNSKAFRSIAIIPYQGGPNANDVAAAIVAPFYTSELSDRFIVSYFTRGIFMLSGGNTDAPFTSYVSVPIEIGVPGGVAFFGIYGLVVFALVRSIRRTSEVQVRILGTWALISLLMLLSIAAIDNYLETTRYTLLVWLSIAVWKIYTATQSQSVELTEMGVQEQARVKKSSIQQQF